MANVHANIDTGLARYLADAKRFPMLTAEEERELAAAWRGRGDRAALRRLIGSHMRLVVKSARGFGGYGLPLAELIAEGNVGLMQAAQKFDPERGFRFSTYAIWWIRAQIQEHILHNWSLVKMGTTAAQKKLFFNLRRLKGRMEELGQGDLSPETVSAIAKELKVPAGEVVEMNRRLATGDSSLNAPIGPEGETDWLEMLMDDGPTQESTVADADELAQRRRLLGVALEQLNDRERDILVERRLKDDPQTLETLSRKYAVSRERVRQIEVRAFEKLQKAVVNADAALHREPMLEAA